MTIKNITIVAVLALTFLTGCDRLEPPPPKPLPTETVNAQAVQMCIDLSTSTRFKNHVCEDKISGFTWVYLVDDGHWTPYIPAAGQKIENGRYRIQRPFGIDIVLAPDEGGYFPR